MRGAVEAALADTEWNKGVRGAVLALSRAPRVILKSARLLFRSARAAQQTIPAESSELIDHPRRAETSRSTH